MAKWMEYLSEDVCNRLAACHSRREDIKPLVDAKWYYYKQTGKDKEGFTKEDALVSILELLDCNSQYIDLTMDEYDALKREG